MTEKEGSDIFIPQDLPQYIGSLNAGEFITKYIYEGLGLILVMFYIISYFYGTHKNNAILQRYYKNCSELYENNFAHISTTKEHDGELYHAESAHSFKFFASGRINCQFLQLSIELQKRQDILSTYLFSFVWPEKDQIKFDIPLSVVPQPLCFAILKKKEASTYKENNIDIKHLTQKVSINNLEGNYVALGEDQEPMNSIFDAKIVSLLNKYDKYISQIHLTDQKTLSRFPYHLRVVFNISENQDEVVELTQMVLSLLDKIANYKLSNQIKLKTEKERQQFQEIKSKDDKVKRMEELQQKKIDKKQSDQQKLLLLPREKQLIQQEKDKKEELRKRFSKRVMRV